MLTPRWRGAGGLGRATPHFFKVHYQMKEGLEALWLAQLVQGLAGHDREGSGNVVKYFSDKALKLNRAL